MKYIPNTPDKTGRRKHALFAAILALMLALQSARAQNGPFPVSDWPASINTNLIVDYWIVDPNASFNTPAGWNGVVSWQNCCDQTYVGLTLAGLYGVQATSGNLNFADPNYTMFATNAVIDVLIQVYGNSSLYNADGSGKNVSFLEGQLNYLTAPSAGQMPAGANNGLWNWMLFEVPNLIDPKTGFRYVGDTSYPQQVNGQFGGVNGGTLRLQGIGSGMTIRAIALGPQGAFGTSNQVNVFLPPPACDPEPAVNLAYIDVNQGLTNHLTVINDAGLGETVTVQAGVGPTNDLRTAFQSTSGLMNFGITSNYLGVPCNPPRTMKLCMEFYDDPALAGVQFGPAQYATDSQGDLQNYAGSQYTMTGSDQWLKVAFWIPGVDLEGVSTTPLTGGPIVLFNGGVPYIDRIELGVVRTGTNALAGRDPDPTYFVNPLICGTNYGYYAEWDPHAGIVNNLTAGSSGGDQNMVVRLAGPTNDLRMAEAPAPGSGNNNLQFTLLNNVFGPSLQDNADVSMILTYYDDPALVGATLYPQVYQSYVNGISAIVTPQPPYNVRATLKGTGQWVDAYFELPDVNFLGVNQGPQSIVRYETTPATPGNPDTGVIYVSRVRYDVIRPCGPFEGINMLQYMSVTGTNQNLDVNWFGTATLQSSVNAAGPYTNTVSVMNHTTNSFVPPGNEKSRFFRLRYPAYPF
jgi:hypothetical protein